MEPLQCRECRWRQTETRSASRQHLPNSVSNFLIMKQTGHISVATLREYIRLGEMFWQNVAVAFGI